MNTQLIVKKTTAPENTYFIQPKYAVISMKVGATLGATICTLQTIRVGWDLEANYNKWKSTKTYDAASGTTTLIGRQNVDAGTGMQGTLGELSIETLNNLVAYNLELMVPSADS
jgi:hypothetical protein